MDEGWRGEEKGGGGEKGVGEKEGDREGFSVFSVLGSVLVSN